MLGDCYREIIEAITRSQPILIVQRTFAVALTISKGAAERFQATMKADLPLECLYKIDPKSAALFGSGMLEGLEEAKSLLRVAYMLIMLPFQH